MKMPRMNQHRGTRVFRTDITAVLRNTKDEIFVRGRASQVPQLRVKEESTTATTESKEVCLELPRDLKQLTALCEQAPCGRGTETVLDTKVRKVLQTDKLDVQWDCLESVVQNVRARLCPWIGQLNAEFYKVLVYQPGDFFACYRDSKKTDRHVATLVVDLGLPCEGGRVVFPSVDPIQEEVDVRKDLPLMMWDSRGTAGEWGCWFTSIYHEVRPLKKGTRVVVVYNLMMAPSSSSSSILHPVKAKRQQHFLFATNNRVGDVLLNSSLLSLVVGFLTLDSAAGLLQVNKQLRARLPRHFLLVHSVRSMLGKNNKLRKHGFTQLGFHLRHTYSFEQDGTCEPWQLKGSDRVLYDVLRSCGLHPSMLSATLMKEKNDFRVVAACLVKSVAVNSERVPGETRLYPEMEYDGEEQWSSKDFDGVYWCASASSKELSRHFCVERQQSNCRENLWGNAAYFAMLAYSTGVLIANLPEPTAGANEADDDEEEEEEEEEKKEEEEDDEEEDYDYYFSNYDDRLDYLADRYCANSSGDEEASEESDNEQTSEEEEEE